MKRPLLQLVARIGLLRPAYRAYERLLALRGRRRFSAADGLPVPPPGLIVRVAGTADTDWFLESGRLGFESIQDTLARQGVRAAELGAVLDFGCGCGRVTRYWHRVGPAISGSDLNDDAVDWCRRNLPFARFEVNGLAPPLAFDDASFDLVYGLSVFTHLPEELQLLWMRELARVLRPGGRLLLTTHGERYLERLGPDERARFERGELVTRWEEVAGTNLCAAFHPPAWVRERLTGQLAHVDFVAEGAKGNPHQDVHLFRK